MRTTRAVKRTLTIAGATLILGGSAFGLANAQSATPAPSTSHAQGPAAQRAPGANDHKQQQQAFLDALAKRLGITTDQLQQAITGARTDAGLPAGGPGGFGFGGPGRSGPGQPGGFRGGQVLDTAAQFLGISTDQLRQEISGTTLSAVAQAHGKSAAYLATALKNAANQQVDQAVSNGRLTADQATQQKQEINQHIDQMLTHQAPTGAPGAPRTPRPTS